VVIAERSRRVAVSFDSVHFIVTFPGNDTKLFYSQGTTLFPTKPFEGACHTDRSLHPQD